MHFAAFNHCRASLLHAGWLHQSWFYWNQPRETQRKGTDDYVAEREGAQCSVGTPLVLAVRKSKTNGSYTLAWFCDTE